MEGTITAVIATIIVAIVLFLVLRYKIRSDKKRKSLATPDYGTLRPEEKKSFLASISSAVLAIITAVVATIVLFGIGEGLGSIIKIKGETGDALAYVLYDLVIVCGCYLIVKHNPGSIWYVPVICNVLGIISAIVEPNFWITPMWIPICSGWILSIVASIAGAAEKKRKSVSVNH